MQIRISIKTSRPVPTPRAFFFILFFFLIKDNKNSPSNEIGLILNLFSLANNWRERERIVAGRWIELWCLCLQIFFFQIISNANIVGSLKISKSTNFLAKLFFCISLLWKVYCNSKLCKKFQNCVMILFFLSN